MNKKANTAPSIVILVVLILVLTLGILFMFYVNGKKSDFLVGSPLFIEKSVFEKNKAEFLINKLSEKNFIESYKESVSKEEFDNNKLKERYEEKLNAEIMKTSLDFEKSGELINNVKDKKSKVSLEGDKIVFNSGEIVFTSFIGTKGKEIILIGDFNNKNDFKEHSGVLYRTSINVSISANKLGLIGFDEVNEVKNKCGNVEKKLECVESLVDEMDVSEKDGKIYLTSKKEFFYGLDEISFKLL